MAQALQNPNPVGALVEVVHMYDSSTTRGHSINVQPGERYSILNSSTGPSDDWVYVGKENDREQDCGFYLPRSHVKLVDSLSTFRAQNEDSRLSRILNDEPPASPLNISQTSSAGAPTLDRKLRLSVEKSPQESRRKSKSIPVDLDFMHNIPDLSMTVDFDDLNSSNDHSTEMSASSIDHPDPRFRMSQMPYFSSESIHRLLNGGAGDEIPFASVTSSNDRSSQGDNGASPQYANLPLIGINRNMRPPMPDPSEKPIRHLHDGWAEFVDYHNRPYFFNVELKQSSWKPPRAKFGSVSSTQTNEPPAVVLSSGEELDSSVDEITSVPMEGKSSSLRTGSISSRHRSSSPGLLLTSDLEGAPPSPEPDYSPPMLKSKNKPLPPIPKQPSEPSPVPPLPVMPPKHAAGLTFVNPAFGLMSKSSDEQIYAYSKQVTELAKQHSGMIAAPNGAGLENASNDKVSHRRSNTLPLRKSVAPNQTYLKAGTVLKSKYAEAGKRLKKAWEPCFLYLTSCHLIFYKDQKQAEKKGVTYNPPQGVCDLRGAKVTWAETSNTRKKNVVQVELLDGTTYLFHAEDPSEGSSWLHQIKSAIAMLPEPERYPTPVVEHNNSSGALAVPDSKVSKKQPNKRKTSANTRHSDSHAHAEVVATCHAPEVLENRDGILERLRKFFKHRPTVDQLKAKGIYKPEPVFGSSLLEICKREYTTMPRFMKECTRIIEARGLDVDGLYRVSGNLSQVQKIRCQVDQDKYDLMEAESDIHVLTSALKLFFRELQEPLFPLTLTKDFQNAIRLSEGLRLKMFKELLGKLPIPHLDTLDHLLRHLITVSKHSSKNRMQVHNLAIVFGPTLFTTNQSDASGAAKKKTSGSKAASPAGNIANGPQSNSHMAFKMITQGQIVEYLLESHEKLFAKVNT